jgi:putative phosphoesterase
LPATLNRRCRDNDLTSRILPPAKRLVGLLAGCEEFRLLQCKDDTMNIGVISDTHNFLDPEVSKLFAGVDHILHAGDIGLPRILQELEQIAPVTAVLGNTDGPLPSVRETELVELGGRKFLVHHIVNPHGLSEALERRLAREQPGVVVFGHTHKPFSQTVGATLFFNPGYAGKLRFGMARSVAILRCDDQGIRPEYLAL